MGYEDAMDYMKDSADEAEERQASLEGLPHQIAELEAELRVERYRAKCVDQQLGWIVSNGASYQKQALLDFIRRLHFAYFGDASDVPQSTEKS